MSDPILPLLVLIVVALLALGAAARFIARASRQAIGLAGAGLSGLGFMLTLLALIVGQEPGTLVLPFGLPGFSLALSFDPLAAFFLLPAFLTGTASIAFAAEIADSSPKASLSGLSLCIAGVVLAILAADGVTLVLGLALAGGAVWASGDPSPARTPLLGVTALSVLAVLGATAASGFAFAAMRERLDYPTALFVLALIGPGALAGLVPFHRWSIPAHRASPARAAALLSGMVKPLALYLLVRLLLDLGAPASAGWWGIVLLAMGSATVVTGGWRAASEAEVGACLAGLAESQSGVAAIGIGLALLGRASDLPVLASLGLRGRVPAAGHVVDATSTARRPFVPAATCARRSAGLPASAGVSTPFPHPRPAPPPSLRSPRRERGAHRALATHPEKTHCFSPFPPRGKGRG